MDYAKKLGAYGNEKSVQISSSLNENLNTSQSKKESCYLAENNFMVKI